MKKVLFSLAALALLVGSPSFAKEKKAAAPATSYDSDSGHGSFWLGLTTDTFATGTTAPGLTGLIGFSDKLGLQMYLAIDGTTPKFGFGVGANIKYNAVGNWNKGFHIGGGFGLGSTVAAATFYANIYGLMGLHWQPTDGILLSADGGLGITIVSGATTMKLGTTSPMLGASILFRL